MKTVNYKGYTLVELLVIISILGIISAVSVPNLLSWYPNYRIRSASKELYNNLQWARMSAIKARENCYIDFNSPGANQYTVNFESKTVRIVNLADHDSSLSFSEAPERITFRSNGLAILGDEDLIVTNSNKKYQAEVFISGAIKLKKL